MGIRANPSGKTRSMPSVVVAGSYVVALCMEVDRLPVTGETIAGRSFLQTHGGKGSNMAVQAARLGALTHFVGRTGDDDFGHDFADLMRREGVDVEHLKGCQLATGVGFIILSCDGQNMIAVDSGANRLFSPSDVDDAAAAMRPGAVVLTQLEIPLGTALHAMRRGRENGCTTILNPAPACDLRQHDLSSVDVLSPNETEARICLGLDPRSDADEGQIASRLLAIGCRTVVITLGARGCLIAGSDSVSHIPAFTPTTVVDTTGAGDSFNGALATALSEGMPLEAAARFANAVAALCCTRRYAIPSLATREEVEDFMSRS